jgi:ribosomal-protein-alanine N-acetyltransferase
MSLPEHNGKGYITEAIKAVVEYGFEQMNLHSIEAVIDPENRASERVLQKNGFVQLSSGEELSSWRLDLNK